MLTSTTRRVIAGLGFVVAILAMIWPGALIANRVTPFVFHLPFFIFWYALWAFLMFAGLAVLYWLDGREAA